MFNLGKQRSTVMPTEVEVTESKVFIYENITPITEQVGEDVFTGYEFDMYEYDKDEYIKLQAEENKTLKAQVETTQEAIDFLLFSC